MDLFGMNFFWQSIWTVLFFPNIDLEKEIAFSGVVLSKPDRWQLH
jgi:hypothetical protein